MKNTVTKQPMSMAMRDLLIEHMDGTPVYLTPQWHWRQSPRTEEGEKVRRVTIDALLARGLLKVAVLPSGFRETVITKQGREALAAALAAWADAMMEAFDDPAGMPPERDTMRFLGMVDRLMAPRRSG